MRKARDYMTEEAKAARRAYKREWSRRNPEKVRQYQQRHWEKLAAQTPKEKREPEKTA